MNGSRHLYGLEVSVQAPAWADLPPVLVTPPGVGHDRVGPRAYRALKRASSNELLQPVLEAYPRGSGFVRDEAEFARRIRQGRELWGRLTLSKHPWAKHEADQAKKICLQRGGPPGWFVIPEGLVLEHGPSLREEFRAIRGLLQSRQRREGAAPRYRRGTVHGWPDYQSTDLSFFMHAMWARASDDVGDLLSKGRTLASVLGEPTPPSAIMFNRTGPLGKAVDGISITATGAYIDARLTGLCCRRRIVFGMPSAGNMKQVRWAFIMKSLQAQLPFLWHLGPPDVAAKLRRWHRPGMIYFSDDISRYDQSVCDLHQRELAEEVIAHLAGDEAAEWKVAWKDLPLLGPGLDTAHEAFLYRKRGMTPSGDLLTAFDGTLINLARVLRCMRVMTGWSLDRVLSSLGTAWVCLVQGDDTVLGVDASLVDEQAYVETSLSLGYSTKLVTGCVFLMHHFDPETGAWAPLASRVFQQTVFNEYSGISPAVELFSFIARTSGPFTRNPWASEILNDLRGAEPFSVYRVEPHNAGDALRNPKFVADVERDLRITTRRAERFKGEAFAFVASHLSDAAAALLDDRAEIPLPDIAPVEAWATAQRIAQYMAIPADDRPSRLTGLPPNSQQYLDFATTTDELEDLWTTPADLAA